VVPLQSLCLLLDCPRPFLRLAIEPTRAYTGAFGSLPEAIVVGTRTEPRRLLVRQLAQTGVTARCVEQCRDACRIFRHEDERIELVVTDVSLPDGNWATVLNCLVNGEVSASAVVCAQTADETLWSEAVWRGVHDLLVEPFDAQAP